MATPRFNRTLPLLAGLLGPFAVAVVLAAPSESGPNARLAEQELREPVVQPRGAAMGDVTPVLLSLTATAGGPAVSDIVTVTHVAGSIDLDTTCALGPPSGSMGVTITADPIMTLIPVSGFTMSNVTCSGTAPGFATATYTCMAGGGGGFANDNTVIDCTITPPPAQLSISGTTDPVRPGPGDPFDFVVDVQNTMGGPASAFSVIMNSMDGLGATPIVDANWACFFGKGFSSLNCDYVGPPLGMGPAPALRIPSMAPMGGVAFSADAFLSVSGGDTVVSANPITIMSGTASSLSLMVVGPPDPAPVGSMISYNVVLMNEDRGIPEDGAPARNAGFQALFTDDLMSGTEAYVSAVGTNWSCLPTDFGDSTGVDCSYGQDIPAGGMSAPLDLTLTAPSGPGQNFNALLDPTADNYAFNPADRAQVVTGLGSNIDMSVAKSASVMTANVGDPIKYTLDLVNNGPSAVDGGGFRVVDVLPPRVAFVAANGVDFNCLEAGGTVTCDYTGSPAVAGSTFQIEIDVAAIAGGATVNTATVAVNAPASDPNPGNDSDAAAVTINPAVDLNIQTMVLLQGAKAANKGMVLVGDQFTYGLLIGNNGPDAAPTFTVSDTLPPEVSFVSAAGTDFNCSEAGGVVTCDHVGPALAMGSFKGIDVNVTAVTPGIASNFATVTATGGAVDGDPTNDTSNTVTTTINAAADLELIKNASANNVIAGNPLTYTLDVTNNGPSDATQFTVEDTLPPQVAFVAAAGTDFNCSESGGLVSCAYGGNGLIAGETIPITIDVVANATGVANNTATVLPDAFNPDPDPTNNGSSAAVTISGGATQGVDLRLEKSAVAATQVGFNFSYVLRVTNIGSQAATRVQVDDDLPDGVAFRGTVGSDWSCREAGGSVQCSYSPGTLGPGQTTAVRIAVAATEPGTPVNTAVVSLAEVDVDPSNNRDSATVSVAPSAQADLSLVKNSLPAAVAVEESFRYEFSVSNAGPVAATGVRLTDMVPPGVEIVSAAGDGWDCTVDGQDVACLLGAPLSVGATSVLLLDVVAPAVPGMLLNNGSVVAEQGDPNPANNQASAQTVVDVGERPPMADLALTKEVDRASANQGELLGYNVTVSNAGPDAATAVQLRDVLPAALELSAITAPGWSCSVTTAEIVCDLLGDLPAGASAGIELTALVLSSSGSIVNQATVQSETADPVAGNSTATATTAVTGFGAPADLELSIDDSLDPVLTGDPFDYFVVLRNNGPGQARGVSLQATLPPGTTLNNLSAPDVFACQIDALTLQCQTPNVVLSGVEFLFTVSLLAPASPGAISLSASVAIVGLGIDNAQQNNFAAEETQVRETPTEAQLGEALLEALGDSNDPVVTENLLPTAALCGNPPPALLEICRAIVDALADGREDEVAEAIRQLVGRQTLTQHTALVEANASQFRNIDARQTFIRGGGGGGQVSLSGLNFRYGNEVLPLSLLQAADAEDEPEISSEGLIKPWGFFINGTISGGEKDPTTREIEFDFDTYGLTAGFDYRFSTRLIAGAAIGYADFDSDSPDGSELSTEGFTYHVYASFYPSERFYVDGRLSYGQIDLDQRRPIKFTIGSLTVDELASAETDADQLSGALGVGLLINKGGWSFTPRASVSFMDAEIDGFTETGTELSLIYDEQDVESLIFSAGFSATRVFSLARGVLAPQFDFSFEHESRNDDNEFNSLIVGAASGSAFFVDADEPDRNYANAGLGLVFVGANGRQAFLSYRKILGLGGFSRWTVNAGLRFEF